MTANFSSLSENQDTIKFNSNHTNLQDLQESLYRFLVQLVNIYPPEQTFEEFKQIFIDCLETGTLEDAPVIYNIVLFNNEEEFHYTLKRSCYILINNWASRRKYLYIQQLINLFANIPVNCINYTSLELIRYHEWVKNFLKTQDYQELKRFNFTTSNKTVNNWSDRYINYLLVAQSLDPKKPKEQQEAAIQLSRQIKEKYKFDLAMYIARSQSAKSSPTRYKNPSIFGDEVLRLIKMIVVKKGKFSYENIAHIFLQQTENQTLKQFKSSLQKYLFFSVAEEGIAIRLKKILTEKLSAWKIESDEEAVTQDLLLRVAKKIINYLTTENRREPSQLFILFLFQGNPLTLVIILLKIICICNNARIHLESRIADLIKFYQDKPENECQWLINFIELYNITFAIYAENVEYNLLKMPESEKADNGDNLDIYRVFAQVKAPEA